jgi:hypothetical protein
MVNPGFEGEYLRVGTAPTDKARRTGEIANGWSDNSSWADVDVAYGRDTINPHRGEASQKIDVKLVKSGAMQFVQKVPVRKGRIHAWKLWIRGQAQASIAMMIRQADAPYKTYGAETATLTPEWKEYTVYGSITEDTDAFLMLRTGSPVTFWIDDSTLEDLTSLSSESPVRQGNMVAGGGSFEAGLPYGWSVRFEGDQAFRPLDPRPVIDKTTAATGQSSLRSNMPAGSRLRVASPLVEYNYGRTHTVSVWAKAQTPTSLRVRLERGEKEENFRLSNQWQRFSLSTNMPFARDTRIMLEVPQTSAANVVWIDGVQLEEKAAASADYIAPEPVELSLRLPQPGHVLLDNEVGRVGIALAGALPTGAKLQLAVVDLAQKSTNLPAVTLPTAELTLPALNNRRGIWKLRAQVVDGNGTQLSAPYELVWARLPRPLEIEPSRSYFGMHLPLSQAYFDIARRVGVRRTRLHDVSMASKWSMVEPEKGKFRFFDEGIDMANKSGIEVLGMLDGAPAWTSTRPREGYWGVWNIPNKPGAADAWENYVRTMVGHYKGRIDRWEIWNEPWGNWWAASGDPAATPELFGELTRRAYRVAKEVNPQAYIIGIDTYPGKEWTDQVLPFAPPEFYDGFSYHEYNDAIFGGPQAVPFLRRTEFMEAQKKHGTPKPLWNTEGGLGGVGSFLTPQTGGMLAAMQPTFQVRFDVTQMAAGVQAFYAYAMHTDPTLGTIDHTYTEYDRSVKVVVAARAVLASLVDGMGTPQRTEPIKGVDYFSFPQNKVHVLWSYDGQEHTVPVPAGMKVLDVWSNPIKAGATVSVGNEPIYFVR